MATEYLSDGSKHSKKEARKVKLKAMGIEEVEKKGVRN